MKSLAKKIILALAVTALGVTFPGPVTAQIYTNVIGLPISQLPDIGTNPITSSDIIPMSNLQGGSLTTVKMNVLNLKSNFLASVSTNLSTLNSVISTNPVTIYNDIITGTNMYLKATVAGGNIAMASACSNAVVLAIGDSYTEPQGGGLLSPSYLFGMRLRSIYGDDGVSGRINGGAGVIANITRTPPTNVWPSTLIGVITPADGTNAVYGTQIYGSNETNICNRVGVDYVATPQSSNFDVCIYSVQAMTTNHYKVFDNATSPTYTRTNWALPYANDWTVSCSSLGGTNYLINPEFLSTNNGVQYWTYGFSGTYNDQLLSVGSNFWAKMISAINPNVILYSSIHLGTLGGDTSIVTHTNLLRGLLGNVSTNVVVVVVGNPPNLGGDQRVIDGYERMACQNFGWFYADLWSKFPSFLGQWNAGQLNYADGGVHASLIGGYARSAALCDLLGVTIAKLPPLNLQNAFNTLPTNCIPPNVVTTNAIGVGLRDPIFNNGGGVVSINEGLDFKSAIPVHVFGVDSSGVEIQFWNNSRITGGNNGGNNTLTGFTGASVSAMTNGTITVTNAAALGSVTTATANAGSVTVTNGISAANVTTTNLCLAGQFGGITQFYVNANGSNSITVPAGKTYFVTWNSARNLNTLIWTNGYGVGSPVTITNLAWPAPGNLILKSGWILSVYDNSGYPAGGVYYPL